MFSSWGAETTRAFGADELRGMLDQLSDEQRFGMVLRAKGIVRSTDGSWLHFDYTPGEPDVRTGSSELTGRLCVIGSELNTAAVAALFGVV